jgi:Papain-like cysteine protease AvrRpt2
MPLRIKKSVDIPIKHPASLELAVGSSESMPILPETFPHAPGEASGRLGVNTVSQLPRDEWCWAACAEVVLRFLGSPIAMCEVAGRKLGRNDCCPSSEVCDVGLDVGEVDVAFDRAGLAANRFGALTFEQVRAQIEGAPALGTAGLQLPRRPVVAGIAWATSGGHLIVISGWRVVGSKHFVKVNDPIYTSGDILFEDLESHYGPNNNGRWAHTWADLRRGV